MVKLFQFTTGWWNIGWVLLIAVIVRACWYSGWMLGRKMKRYSGNGGKETVKMRLVSYLVLLFFETMWAFLLKAVIGLADAHLWWQGMSVGLMFFFCMASPLGVVYSFQLKQPGVLLIHAGYLLVVSVLMSAVLACI
jgi:hypothetical protein